MSEEGKTWKCKLPDFDLVSPNKMLRMHFGARSRMKKGISVCIVAYADEMTELSPMIDLDIKRYYGYRKRAFDKDNLYGSAKFLIDALRDHKIIPDDTPKHINLTVTQDKSPTKETFVEITAREVR